MKKTFVKYARSKVNNENKLPKSQEAQDYKVKDMYSNIIVDCGLVLNIPYQYGEIWRKYNNPHSSETGYFQFYWSFFK